MPPETTTSETELPYGSTVEAFRTERAEAAQRVSDIRHERFKHIFEGDGVSFTLAEMHEYELLIEAAANAWSVVAILAWIRKHHGDESAYKAAAVAQDIGINGAPWDDSLMETTADES